MTIHFNFYNSPFLFFFFFYLVLGSQGVAKIQGKKKIKKPGENL
jgi:hypothetical protein